MNREEVRKQIEQAIMTTSGGELREIAKAINRIMEIEGLCIVDLEGTRSYMEWADHHDGEMYREGWRKVIPLKESK